MRKAWKAIMATAGILVLSAVNVFAFENKESILSFTTNGQKDDTDELGYKVSDGDNYGYITTLSSYNGKTSGVFPRGGTFYARIRNANQPSYIYTDLFTFTADGSQSRPYNNALFNSYYIVRGETEGITYPYPSGYVYQCLRWCP